MSLSVSLSIDHRPLLSTPSNQPQPHHTTPQHTTGASFQQPQEQWAGSALGLPLPLGLTTTTTTLEHQHDEAGGLPLPLNNLDPEQQQEGTTPIQHADSGRNVHFGLPSPQSPSSPSSLTPTGGNVSWVRERYLRLFPHVPEEEEEVEEEEEGMEIGPVGLVSDRTRQACLAGFCSSLLPLVDGRPSSHPL